MLIYIHISKKVEQSMSIMSKKWKLLNENILDVKKIPLWMGLTPPKERIVNLNIYHRNYLKNNTQSIKQLNMCNLSLRFIFIFCDQENKKKKKKGNIPIFLNKVCEMIEKLRE